MKVKDQDKYAKAFALKKINSKNRSNLFQV